MTSHSGAFNLSLVGQVRSHERRRHSEFRPTTKQYLYVDERIAQAQSGRWLSQGETARTLHISPATISVWNRDAHFLRWFAREVRERRHPLVELARSAIVIQTIKGHPKFAELFAELYGYEDGTVVDDKDPSLNGGGCPSSC